MTDVGPHRKLVAHLAKKVRRNLLIFFVGALGSSAEDLSPPFPDAPQSRQMLSR
jgi:hypothetical protein